MSFSSSSPFSSTGLKWLWLTVLFLVIDQVTKHWVAGTFNLYESIEVMPYFNLTYVHNEGAAFSFLADQGGWQRGSSPQLQLWQVVYSSIGYLKHHRQIAF